MKRLNLNATKFAFTVMLITLIYLCYELGSLT